MDAELPVAVDLPHATHQQIERWTAVYRSASAFTVPLLEEAAAWLHRHAAPLEQASIVHGDPGPGNFLHDGIGVVAFTDWEFAHIGDPMEDWVYLISIRGARTMPADRWRAMIDETVGIEVTDWHMRYWGAFNFFKGACANLTCLDVFARAEPSSQHGNHRHGTAADLHPRHGHARRRMKQVVDPPVPLSTTWFRLEILAPVHNEHDYEAWMSSIEHIHETAGFALPDGEVTTGRRRCRRTRTSPIWRTSA